MEGKIGSTIEDKVNRTLFEIFHEYKRARSIHRNIISAHEAWGLMDEEFQEFKVEVQANDLDRAKREALQIAAMAVAFIAEVDTINE